MKGGVVAAIEALRALASLAGPDGTLPAPFAGEAMFVGVPSEEDGGAGTLAAIRAGWTGDAAIVTEPTRLAVVTAAAGAITFRLTVRGRAAHASTRLKGVSALEKLEVLHAALRADEDRRNAAETDQRMRALGMPYPTIIGKIAVGVWASTVPALVVAEGRYGVRPGRTRPLAELAAASRPRAPPTRGCGAPATVELAGGSRRGRAAGGPPRAGPVAAAVDRGVAPEVIAVPTGRTCAFWMRAGRRRASPGPGTRDAHAADDRSRWMRWSGAPAFSPRGSCEDLGRQLDDRGL
jgi:acetylornithine deacetylase